MKQREEQCWYCRGEGESSYINKAANLETYPCQACNGTGKVYMTYDDMFDMTATPKDEGGGR